jgi:hypothetical protein
MAEAELGRYARGKPEAAARGNDTVREGEAPPFPAGTCGDLADRPNRLPVRRDRRIQCVVTAFLLARRLEVFACRICYSSTSSRQCRAA